MISSSHLSNFLGSFFTKYIVSTSKCRANGKGWALQGFSEDHQDHTVMGNSHSNDLHYEARLKNRVDPYQH